MPVLNCLRTSELLLQAAAVKSKQMADKAVAVADKEQKLSNEKNIKLEVHDSSWKERSEKVRC